MILLHQREQLYRNIVAEMVSLGVPFTNPAAEIAFRTWFLPAWLDSGCTQNFAVLTQPANQLSIQFGVRVATAGHRVNVYWGDGSMDSIAPATVSNTSLAHTYAYGSSRPIIVLGKVVRFESANIDGKTAFGGRVGWLSSLTYLYVTGSNTISGSISGLTSLTHMEVTGFNTISGSISGLTSLTLLNAKGSNTLSGSVAGLTALTYLNVTGSNTLSGSVTGLTALTALSVYGSNTLSGSVTGKTALTTLNVGGSNTLTGWGAVAVAATGLCYLSHGGLTVLDAAEINAVLAGFWANRDAAKSRSDRVIDLGKDAPTPNAAPTGQGIIDRDALRLYRSPTPPGTAALWTVTTN